MSHGRRVNRKDKREFKYESATATIFVDTNRTAALARLLARKPRLGHGSELMRQICSWADSEGIMLWLEVQRFHYHGSRGMSNDELVAFYMGFGFRVVESDGRLTTMER